MQAEYQNDYCSPLSLVIQWTNNMIIYCLFETFEMLTTTVNISGLNYHCLGYNNSCAGSTVIVMVLKSIIVCQ